MKTAHSWRAVYHTRAHRRMVDAALRLIERWLSLCSCPCIAVSGGKDSTALLQLVHQVDASVPIYRADMPVPLSDRSAHVALLCAAAGGDWRVVPYSYDVAGVLRGDVRYPAGLKQKLLRERMVADGIDGLAMGLRAVESRGRQWNLNRRGVLYQAGTRWVCTPLARWSAMDVLALIVGIDALPLNPVYTRLDYLHGGLEYLRDGTWMPNQVSEALGYRTWLEHYYPEHVEDYDAAVIALNGGR